MIISDDIGSFPVIGIEKSELDEIGFKIISKSAIPTDIEKFNKTVSEIMELKISSGIMRPNYPQIREMVLQFFRPIDSFYKEPWIISKNRAIIPELSAIDETAKKYYEENKKPIELRVCITGPLEIYFKNVGPQVQKDIILNIAKSLSLFVENSILNKSYIKTKTISIDEPSLGLIPNLVMDEEDLIEAFDIACRAAKKLDVQIHLHSATSTNLIYNTKYIKIIGVESAENPKNLKNFEKSELESYDRFIRVGIARTNINGIASDYKSNTGIDVFQNKDKMDEMIDSTESVRIIKKRLENAYKMFRDSISYTGPDCGLGSWPSQEIAKKLLINISKAVSEFNRDKI